MKPWQASLNKRRNKERGLKLEPEEQNPKWVTLGHTNKLIIYLVAVQRHPHEKTNIDIGMLNDKY
jgi:hypothetical protein